MSRQIAFFVGILAIFSRTWATVNTGTQLTGVSTSSVGITTTRTPGTQYASDLPDETTDINNNKTEEPLTKFTTNPPYQASDGGNVTRGHVTTAFTGAKKMTSTSPGTTINSLTETSSNKIYTTSSGSKNTPVTRFNLTTNSVDVSVTLNGDLNDTTANPGSMSPNITHQPPMTTPNPAVVAPPTTEESTTPNNVTTVVTTPSSATSVVTTATATTQVQTTKTKQATTTTTTTTTQQDHSTRVTTTTRPSHKRNITIDIDNLFVPGTQWRGTYNYDHQDVPFYIGFISNEDNRILSARMNDGKVTITMSGEYTTSTFSLDFKADKILSRYTGSRFEKESWSMVGVISMITYPVYLYSGHMTGEKFGNFHMQLDLSSSLDHKVSDGQDASSGDTHHGRDVPASLYIVAGVVVPVVVVACIIASVYFYRAKRRGSFHLQTSLLSFSNPLYDGEPNSGLSTGPL